jgi:hypothetical protein
VPGQLHLLLRGEVGEDLALEPARLLLQLVDLGGEVDGPGREAAELVDLALEVDDRALEVQDLALALRLNGHLDASGSPGVQ